MQNSSALHISSQEETLKSQYNNFQIWNDILILTMNIIKYKLIKRAVVKATKYCTYVFIIHQILACMHGVFSGGMKRWALILCINKQQVWKLLGMWDKAHF